MRNSSDRNHPFWCHALPWLSGLLMVFALFDAAHGQRLSKSPPAPEAVVQAVGIDQKLDEQLPLDLTFVDETGRTVRLGDYFNNDRPVLLSLVYYGCPSLCTMTLNGMSTSFKPLSLEMGRDFEVVTISFDPSETHELAAEKKQGYLKSLGREDAAKGWHFLTGDEANIRRLTEAVGFRYLYDEHSQQFAHASALMVLTPKGKLSRYLYGLEYATTDLRLALVEASENKIGTLADQVLLLCYRYDPLTGRYGWVVITSLRVAAAATVVTLIGFITWWLRRERRSTSHPTPAAVTASAAGALPSTTRA